MRRGARLGLIAVCLIAAAGATGLGFWQLGRLRTRRAANRIALAGLNPPPVSLNATPADDSLRERRATVTGTFDYRHRFYLRGRSERDAPGVHLVIPLILSGREDAVLAPIAASYRPTTRSGPIPVRST